MRDMSYSDHLTGVSEKACFDASLDKVHPLEFVEIM
jgi:hypothetical protein